MSFQTRKTSNLFGTQIKTVLDLIQELFGSPIDPFTVYVTGKFEVRMSGSESSFHPIELYVNQRISRQDKMPTCCVVDCENRTSSGVKFFRIPAGSHPFQKNRRHL